MRKLSLRLRLTLVTMAVLTLICVLLTSFSVFSVTRIAGFTATSLYDIESELMDVSTITIEVIPNFDSNVSEEFVFTGSAHATAYEYADYVMVSTATLAEDAMTAAINLSEAKASYDYTSLTVMVLMIVGGSVLVYVALGYALRPVRRLSTDIQQISENRLSTRVEAGTSGDEINQLALSFNHMLGRLEKAFAAQKQFSSAAAHELKTPLAAIRANLDVLALDEHPDQDEVLETLEIVRNQTGRMTRLVEDLFAMSSLQDYAMNESVEVDRLTQGVVDELTAAIRERDLLITVTPCGCTVPGSALMLSRALSNLVENAVKYNVTGGSINIACGCEGSTLTLTVADTGIGIPAEHLPHIFDAFYRVDDSRSRKLGGAGLGLAISREIIEKHGGALAVTSAPGDGTVFTATLPVSRA